MNFLLREQKGRSRMAEAKQIERDQVQDIIGLTPLQEGMLFHYLNPQDREHYFEQLCVWLEGDVQADLVQHAWNLVIANNEALRSVFRWQKLKSPLQIVLKKWNFTAALHDCSQMPAEQRINFLYQLKKDDQRQGFDLTEVPFRVTLCKESEQKYVMMISNHHILYDGWSNGIILSEFLDAYQHLYRNVPYAPGIKTSNKEYLKYVQSQGKAGQEHYWRSYLAGFDTKSLLPAFPSPSEKEEAPGIHNFRLPAEQTLELIQCVRSLKITLAAFVYTAWGILLQRYTNSAEALFGTTVSGRTDKVRGMESMVGLYINTLPFRVTAKPEETVSELLARMEEALRVRNDFEATALIDVYEYSDIDKREGLFESVLVFENYPLNAAMQDEEQVIRFTDYEMSESTPYEMLLSIHPGNELNFQMQYALHKFPLELVTQLSKHFLCLIHEMITRPEASVDELHIMTEQDTHRLLTDFNGSCQPIPIQHTIQQHFEMQAACSPQRTAIIYGQAVLTYEQLNKRANLLAHHLRAKQVEPERIVGILLERSADAIVSMLAVLKAGGAYMPIDPEYPVDRIKHMLEGSGCKHLLTQRNWLEKLDNADIETVLLSEFDFEKSDPGNPEPINEISDLAYIIYTSGSTGKPKGVMVEHRNLNSFIYSFMYDQLQAEDRGIWQSSLSFDTSVEEIFPLLLRGGTLVILPRADVLDINRLVHCIQEQQITFMSCSPHLIHQLNGRLTDHRLRLLISGGDELKWSYCDDLRGMKLYNSYGPSETTVAVTYYECLSPTKGRIPIGGPIANHYFAVVDRLGRLQPYGAEGELWIAGPSVVRGYLNSPEMTAEKFDESPYFPGERMYKTGDLVRWLPGGLLDYLGRVDQQVKIRGYRIELAEIECALLNCSGIREAAVLAVEVNNGHRTLCAYYVGIQQSESALRSYLQERLPAYMIPSYFVHMEKMPLTVNGKLDRHSLPAPAMQRDNETRCVAPSNEIEQQLLRIWQELLPTERIGIHDNFFEIGGDSILLMRMHAQIDMLYPNRVSITDLFAYMTISKLAQFIGEEGAHIQSGQVFEGVVLPQVFFTRMPDGSARQIKHFECAEPLYSKLRKLAQGEGLETHDVALGMFMYLLQQASGQQAVEVQSIVSRTDTVVPIRVDFNAIEDFFQLFSFVKEINNGKWINGSHSLQTAIVERRGGLPDTAIVPLFVKSGLISNYSALTRSYDLILEFRETRDRLEFCYEYSRKLSQEGLDHLVLGYNQLLADLVEQYELLA